MNNNMKIGLIVVGVILLALFPMGCYKFMDISTVNSLRTASQAADEQWSVVESKLQRRFDLVPNLVAAVQGAFTQEQTVFGDLAEARTRYAGAGTTDEKVQAANEYESALGRLLVIVENNPTLMSTQAVRDLMGQLEGTENRISVERDRYGEKVNAYNDIVVNWPGSYFAEKNGFTTRSYFKASEEAVTTVPKVELNTNLQTTTTR